MSTASVPRQGRVYGAVVAAATASVLPVFLFGDRVAWLVFAVVALAAAALVNAVRPAFEPR